VFALNWEELRADATVVEDTFTIHGCSITALIDLNSTHSFVNEICACYLDWVGEELPYLLHVSTLLKADLIVMPIEDYDLILGMD
jgi:hypothetical protein